MRLIDFYQKLEALNQSYIYSRDVAALFQISRSHASKLLARLAASGLLIHLTTGLWGFSQKMDPLVLPGYLTAPFECYLSLFTALYRHDMIMQIPSMIYVVSPARTHIIKTPVAVISVHHVTPDFFIGYKVDEKSGIKMATPEKTIVDYAYFQIGKSSSFHRLPELELPSSFDRQLVDNYISKIASKSKRASVRKIVEELLKSK